MLWTARGSVKAGLAQRSWPASHQRARSGHCTARASTVLILAFFFHNTNDSHGDDVLPRLPARPLIGRPGVQAPPSQELVGRRGAGCSYATGRRETGHRQAQRCRAKCARKGHGRLAPFLLAAEPSPRVLTGLRRNALFARAVRQSENPHHRRACPTQPQQVTMSRRGAVMDAGHRRPDGPERAVAGSSKQGGPVACPPQRARRPAGADASGAGPDPLPLPAVRRSSRRRKPSKPDPSAAQTPRRPCTSPPAAPRVRSPKSGRATTRSARQKSSRRPAKASAQRGPQPRTYRVNRLLGRYGHRLLILWTGGSTSLGTTKDIVDKGLLKDLTKDYTGLDQGVDLLDWRRGKNGRGEYRIRWPGLRQTIHRHSECRWVGANLIDPKRRDCSLPSIAPPVR